MLLYLALLLLLTLMPAPGIAAERVRLQPLVTIRSQLRAGGWPFLINVVGNIVAVVPLGLLLPSAAPRFRRVMRTVGLGLLLSAAIELAQLLATARVLDIDDVLLNGLGTLLGYLLFSFKLVLSR